MGAAIRGSSDAVAGIGHADQRELVRTEMLTALKRVA